MRGERMSIDDFLNWFYADNRHDLEIMELRQYLQERGEMIQKLRFHGAPRNDFPDEIWNMLRKTIDGRIKELEAKWRKRLIEAFHEYLYYEFVRFEEVEE